MPTCEIRSRLRKFVALCVVSSSVIWGTINASRAGGPVLWIGDSTGTLGRVDVTTGEVTVVGPSGVTLTDIAFDPDGNLWGISSSNLYSVNTTTGAATVVGPTGIGGGNALVFGTDGTLYAAGTTSTSLYTVDTSTGVGTALGDIRAYSAGDLAFNGGDLYLSSLENNNLVRITLTPSVSGTTVGPIGFNEVWGLATGDDGVLYGAAGLEILTVNPATGQGTSLLNYGGHGLGPAFGTAFINEAVPAPGGIAVLLLAGVSIGRRRRFRSM
jgi:hypothetical protein